MFFKHDHIQKIINKTKTETRRVVKLGEFASMHNGAVETVFTKSVHPKWTVGNDYAVQPGRGKPGLLWCAETKRIWSRDWARENPMSIEHFVPLRIRLLSIYRKRLQDISEADAVAEGYPYKVEWHHTMIGRLVESTPPSPIQWYRQLWQSINGPKSWDANPDVWVLTFEIVQ